MPSNKFSQGHTRSAKLTAMQVIDIRVKFADGATQGSLAREYGVTVGTIGRITRGETWNQFQFVESEGQVDARLAKERLAFGPRPPPTQDEILASQRKLAAMLGEAAPPDLMKAVEAEAAKDAAEAKEARDSEQRARETIDKQLDEFTQKGDSHD